MKEIMLNGNEYDFSIEYSVTEVNNIPDIKVYLMGKIIQNNV